MIRDSSRLITSPTPIRKPECRELLQWEHEWNNQAVAEDLQVIVQSRNRTLFLQEAFCITLMRSVHESDITSC